MGQVWFTSDLHQGHRRIGMFRKIPNEFLEEAMANPVEGIEPSTLANSLWISYWWNKLVGKRDIVICLGDSAFTQWGLDQIGLLPGRKKNYGGNHDDLPIDAYLEVFEEVRGCKKQSKVGWLSHFPLHPDELRGHFSIHGHVHYATIDDWRYLNVCCDNLFEEIGRPMISLTELKQILEKRRESNKVEYL